MIQYLTLEGFMAGHNLIPPTIRNVAYSPEGDSPLGRCVTVTVESFGYRHDPPPTAHLTLDLREFIRDPHTIRLMRELTGLDPSVIDRILTTPGVREMTQHLVSLVTVLAKDLYTREVITRVAIGCAGGRHRSVVIANELANQLNTADIGTQVTHRDVLKPVVQR